MLDLSRKKFVLSMIIRIFAAREPAKPLNDAQMCGSFLFLCVYGNKNSIFRYAYPFSDVFPACTRGFFYYFKDSFLGTVRCFLGTFMGIT